MGNKVFVKRGYDKRYGSWIAKTNQVDYYLIFNFGSSTMTSSTLYKITKEIFDEIDDEMDFKQIEPKTQKIYRYARFCTPSCAYPIFNTGRSSQCSTHR